MSSVLTPAVLEEKGIKILYTETQKLGSDGNTLLPMDEVFTHANQYFAGHYFLNDPPLSISSWPFGAVLDLETMEIMGKANTDLTPEMILQWADEVAEEE